MTDTLAPAGDHRQDWGKRTAVTIGRQVAHYRTLRRVERVPGGPRVTEPITLQELSDRCAALGYPIARSVISKLEKGHRHSVTVDEVQVLAQALGVAPVLLLFPLGRGEDAEILPGVEADPSWAIAWFCGQSADPVGGGDVPQMGGSSPLVLWNMHGHHDQEVASYQEVIDKRGAATLAYPPESGMKTTLAQVLQASVDSLRRIRESIRELGLTPPALSPETAAVLGEETDNG